MKIIFHFDCTFITSMVNAYHLLTNSRINLSLHSCHCLKTTNTNMKIIFHFDCTFKTSMVNAYHLLTNSRINLSLHSCHCLKTTNTNRVSLQGDANILHRFEVAHSKTKLFPLCAFYACSNTVASAFTHRHCKSFCLHRMR